MWLPVDRLTMMLHMAKIHITQEASNITFLEFYLILLGQLVNRAVSLCRNLFIVSFM